jgi:hypothetical protein
MLGAFKQVQLSKQTEPKSRSPAFSKESRIQLTTAKLYEQISLVKTTLQSVRRRFNPGIETADVEAKNE